MKKLFSLVMLVAALTVGFASCGGNENDDPKPPTPEVKVDPANYIGEYIYAKTPFANLNANKAEIVKAMTDKVWEVDPESVDDYPFGFTLKDPNADAQKTFFLWVMYNEKEIRADAAYKREGITDDVLQGVMQMYGASGIQDATDAAKAQMPDVEKAFIGKNTAKGLTLLMIKIPYQQDATACYIVMFVNEAA